MKKTLAGISLLILTGCGHRHEFHASEHIKSDDVDQPIIVADNSIGTGGGNAAMRAGRTPHFTIDLKHDMGHYWQPVSYTAGTFYRVNEGRLASCFYASFLPNAKPYFDLSTATHWTLWFGHGLFSSWNGFSLDGMVTDGVTDIELQQKPQHTFGGLTPSSPFLFLGFDDRITYESLTVDYADGTHKNQDWKVTQPQVAIHLCPYGQPCSPNYCMATDDPPPPPVKPVPPEKKTPEKKR